MIRPILGITMGDAAGVGPEIIARAAEEPEVARTSRPVVIGDAAAMREAIGLIGSRLTLHAVTDIRDCRWDPGVLEVLDLGNVDMTTLPRGAVSAQAGRAAYEYIERAVRLEEVERRRVRPGAHRRRRRVPERQLQRRVPVGHVDARRGARGAARGERRRLGLLRHRRRARRHLRGRRPRLPLGAEYRGAASQALRAITDFRQGLASQTREVAARRGGPALARRAGMKALVLFSWLLALAACGSMPTVACGTSTWSDAA